MLSAWVSSRHLGDAARSSVARVATKKSADNNRLHHAKKSLNYAPWNGSFLFWYKNHLLSYRTELLDVGFHKEEQVSLTCFGRSSQVLRDLLGDCRDEYLNQIKNKTTIFEHRGERWKKTGAKEIRPLSTVILAEKEKQALIDDIKDFLDPETRRWYIQRALPYRRGYLLGGPPGTGKSSLSLSVAGEFDLDIYVVSIPNTTDQSLKDLFDNLPEKCVVLLEDIDAAGVTRSSSPQADDSDGEGTPRRKDIVTLSGLLNTLDGVASQEGRIVIMTTNHAEKLDDALIRPGRVDKKVEFRLADKEVVTQLFRFIFEQSEETCMRQGAESDSSLERQAVHFASEVPELAFSQAEIISHLLHYRNWPTGAVENSKRWASNLLQEKNLLDSKSSKSSLRLSSAGVEEEILNDSKGES